MDRRLELIPGCGCIMPIPEVRRHFIRIVVIALVSMAPHTPAWQPPPTTPCTEQIPAGLRPFDEVAWDGPWVLALQGPAARPMHALDNKRELTNGPIPIRLDSGKTGTLRIESRPCAASDDCEPFDCGCPLADESYWIHIRNAGGNQVARLHLWAAYGRFQIVPADLVDGPGDELIIARIHAHAAPPTGYDLKIWKIGAQKPIVLREKHLIANTLPPMPIACARWRTRLFIDPAVSKPRPILLRTERGSKPCCRIFEEDEPKIAPPEADGVLRFDAALAKYVLDNRTTK
jgi:hypothetical protein